MTRIVPALAFVAFAFPGALEAQEPYKLIGYLDLPAENAIVSRTKPMTAAGWVFECKSGLQPLSQRVGAMAVAFTATGGSLFVPKTFTLTPIVGRPDVQLAFGSLCPAVGPWTGYGVKVEDMPPAGAWTLIVSWTTWDGKGVPTSHEQRRALIVQ